MEKFYGISMKKTKKGYLDVRPKVRYTKAKNYKEASKKLNVSQYAMRTFGMILPPMSFSSLYFGGKLLPDDRAERSVKRKVKKFFG